MYETIKNWTGAVEINGVLYNSCEIDFNSIFDTDNILLHCKTKSQLQSNTEQNKRIGATDNKQYKITVKPYMLKKSSPQFDFMAKWNDDNPMPLRTMIGYKIDETHGMVKMRLHGDTDGKPVLHCMKCGKQITNPISQFFGLGPECGQHHYTNPFESEEELQAVVDNYRKNYLQKITWEGWIIKSAIIEEEEYD